MDHEDLVAAVEKAIDNVFADTTVSLSTTRDSLHSIMEYIQSCLDAMYGVGNTTDEDKDGEDIKDILDNL